MRVLTVDPGEMNTRMHADAMPEADPTSLAAPEQVARGILGLLTASGTAAAASGVRVGVRLDERAS